MVGEMSLKEILAEPQDNESLHIPQNTVIDLIFRLLFNEGNVALSRFVEVLKIPSRLVDNLLLWMQKEHLVEVSKANSELGRLGYVYTLVDAGEQRHIRRQHDVPRERVHRQDDRLPTEQVLAVGD